MALRRSTFGRPLRRLYPQKHEILNFVNRKFGKFVFFLYLCNHIHMPPYLHAMHGPRGRNHKNIIRQ